VFAALLNVPLATARSWEQGKRNRPARPCACLDWPALIPKFFSPLEKRR